MESVPWDELYVLDALDKQSAESRVIEMIQDKFPHLLLDSPAILGLCAVYFQRKVREKAEVAS